MSTIATETDWRTKLHPIFADCVAKINRRYQPTHPWVAHGFVWATDGQIIVRRAANGITPDDVGVPKNPPPAHDLGWSRGRFESEPINLPSVPPETRFTDCRECKGKGKFTECQECDGTGYVECDLGHEHDCEECDGTGKLIGDSQKCGDCDGTGKVPDNYTIKFGALGLCYRHVCVLMSHGALVYPDIAMPESRPAYFIIPDTGIDGLVMPRD